MKWQAAFDFDARAQPPHHHQSRLSDLPASQISSTLSVTNFAKRNAVATWSGCVLGGNTVFLSLSSLDTFLSKEVICSMMELAEQALSCNKLILCLEKQNAKQDLVRALVACGFQLVNPALYSLNNCILVGYEF